MQENVPGARPGFGYETSPLEDPREDSHRHLLLVRSILGAKTLEEELLLTSCLLGEHHAQCHGECVASEGVSEHTQTSAEQDEAGVHGVAADGVNAFGLECRTFTRCGGEPRGQLRAQIKGAKGHGPGARGHERGTHVEAQQASHHRDVSRGNAKQKGKLCRHKDLTSLARLSTNHVGLHRVHHCQGSRGRVPVGDWRGCLGSDLDRGVLEGPHGVGGLWLGRLLGSPLGRGERSLAGAREGLGHPGRRPHHLRHLSGTSSCRPGDGARQRAHCPRAGGEGENDGEGTA
mmetsp:Transcript_4077/g.11596  ORF Transcript_4077/g.11596 Transcript_4077/m.11596 type:complete len:289 (-) Transcript_4077:20-886(-)